MTTNNSSNTANATSGLVASMVPIQSQTASTSPFIEFAGLSSVYREYYIILDQVGPDTGSAKLQLQVFLAGSFNAYLTTGYANGCVYTTSASGTITSLATNEGDTVLKVSAGIGLSASSDAYYNGKISMRSCGDATKKWNGELNGQWYDGSNRLTIFGTYAAGTLSAPATKVKFYFDSGNILSGIFTLYGIPA